MRYLLISATGFPVGPFVNPNDGVTPVSNLVASSLNGIAIFDGVASTFIPTSLVYLANGQYEVSAPPSLSLGNLRISFSNPTGFAPVWDDFSVISQNVYNSFFGTQSLVPSASGSGSDPWAVSLPGSYLSGQAGFIVGANLNATVASRSTYAGGAVASVTAPVTITQAFPANFASLGINASGKINEVILVDSVTSVVNPVAITQSFPANFSSLGISVAGKISEVILTDTATNITNPVILPTVPPSGYGGSASDPWLTNIPGAYSGSQAGYVVGIQSSIPIVGTVHAGAGTTSLTFTVNSGNAPVTPEAIDGRGCLFKTGSLIGAYPNIITSSIVSAGVVTITVSGLPVPPSLNDVVWII